MSIDITAELPIRRPLPEVAAYMIDPAHDPEWIGGVARCGSTPPPLAVGSRVARVAHFLGRRVEYVNEVTELDPAGCSTCAPCARPSRCGDLLFEASDGGGSTIVRNRVRGTPRRVLLDVRAAARPDGQALGAEGP